jgi:hypothetical protein
MVLYYKESYGALGKTVLLTPVFPAVLMTFGIFSLLVIYFFVVFLKRGKSLQNVYGKQLADFSKQHQEIWMFLLFWILCNIVLLYLPLPPQRRFIQGLQIPIIILGSMTLFYLLIPSFVRWVRRWKESMNEEKVLLIVAGVIFVLHLASPVWVLAVDSYALANYRGHVYHSWNYYYIPQQIYQGLQYIKDADLQGTILSNAEVGNWIPTLNGNRVYQGHSSQTLEREKKQKDWEQFLTREEGNGEKYGFLKKHNISYVIYINGERERAAFKDLRYLQLVYGNERIEIYKVLNI